MRKGRGRGLRRAGRDRIAAVLLALALVALTLEVSATPVLAAGAFTDVAAGRSHSCAIRAGSVWCWGANDRGQLGTQTPSDVAAWPVIVHGISTAIQVAAGANHTCALLADTSVKCWGANNTGQLGDGTTEDRWTPVAVPISGVTSITAGRAHTCALAQDGNDEIQALTVDAAGGTFKLGYGASATPALAWNVDATALQAALTALPGIGAGGVSVRGGPGATAPFVIAFRGGLAHTDVASLATNSAGLQGAVGAATVSVVADGATARVWCWGSNATGQLGSGDVADLDVVNLCLSGLLMSVSQPACTGAKLDVGPAGDGWIASSSTLHHISAAGRELGSTTLGIAAGAVAAALDPQTGDPIAYVSQQGANEIRIAHADGTDQQLNYPQAVLQNCSITGLAFDASFALYVAAVCTPPAQQPEGRVYRFDASSPVVGPAVWVQSLGTSILPSDLTVDAPQGATEVIHVATQPSPAIVTLNAATGNSVRTVPIGGASSACYLSNGTYGIGHLADGGVAATAAHLTISSAFGQQYATFDSSCVETRSTNGVLLDSVGDAPDPILGGPPVYADVAGTPDGDLLAYDAMHGQILKMGTDGTLRPGWGKTLFASSPIPGLALEGAVGGGTISAVEAGGGSTCAVEDVAQGGQPWCWGDDGAGQLDGTLTADHTSFPQQASHVITGASDALALGIAHGCAVVSAGPGATCWGDDDAGQASLPSLFGTPAAVAAGAEFSCAVFTDATAQCWGSDDEGQRADAGIPPNSIAHLQGPSGQLGQIDRLHVGVAHGCLIQGGDAAVYCWGRNDDNQVAADATPFYDHAVKVLFPGDPGFPGVNVTLSGPNHAPAVDQYGPFVVTFDQEVADVDGSDVQIAPDAQHDAPLATLGAPRCFDDQGTKVPCSAGPVASVEIDPAAPLVDGTDYVGIVNAVGARTATVTTGSFDLPETVTNTVAANLSDRVTLTLANDAGGTTVPLHGPLVVSFSDTATGLPVTLDGVNESAMQLSVVGDPQHTPIRMSIVECRDDADVTVDCLRGPVASTSIVPDHALEPSSSYVVRLNPRRPSSDDHALLSGLGAPTGLAVDDTYVYWTDRSGGSIGRAWLDGTHINAHFIDDVGSPSALAVDGSYLYWTDSAGGRIGRADLDGENVNLNFVVGANQPSGVAASPDFLYWTNRGSDTIGRAKLNGQLVNQSYIQRPAPANPLLSQPVGIAVNDANVYWTNTATGTLGRANTDDAGSGAALILNAPQALGIPRGIDMDAGHLYWADRASSSVGRLDLPNAATLDAGLIPGIPGAQDVAVDQRSIYWTDPLSGLIGQASTHGVAVTMRAGQPVPAAESNPVDAGPLGDVAITLTGSGPGHPTTVDGDGPYLVTFDQAVSKIDEQNLILVKDGSSTPIPAAIVDCSDGTAVVDCLTGAVTEVRIGPDQTLAPGDYLAMVNPDYDAAVLAQLGPATVKTATSGPITVEGAQCQGPICGKISGPGGDPDVPSGGPIVITFNQGVTNVTIQNLLVLVGGPGGAPVSGSIVCRGINGDVVDCITGPVVTVEFSPDAPLVPGQSYVVVINPSGVVILITYQNQPVDNQTVGPVVIGGDLPETDPAILYRWGGGKNHLAVGGRISVEQARGASATFPFTGKKIIWYSAHGPRFGYASVKIDGTLVDEVNTYGKTTRYGVQRSYRHLAAGPHSITITAEGRKGATTARGTAVAVDAFKVLTPQGWKLTPNPVPSVTWGTGTSPVASQGTYATGAYPGAATNLIFLGTTVRWHTLVGPKMGRAVVFIDGQRVKNVSLFAANEAAKTVSFTGLTKGLHRFRIMVRAPKKGRGSLVAIDGFTVEGA